MAASDFPTTRLEILPEWADANGHMNVAYYVLAFDRATDTFYDALGIGWAYLAREHKSVFTLAMNVDYLREVRPGSAVRIESRLIDVRERFDHVLEETAKVVKDLLKGTGLPAASG